MDIKEIREKFPQYNDLPDDQLLRGIHGKYYSDIPYEKFVGKSVTQGTKQTEQSQPIGKMERFTKGLRDPIDAGAQLLEKAFPDEAVKNINKFNNWLAENTGIVGKLPDGGVDQQVRDAESVYQSKRGDKGFDAYRLAGNILSPANLAIASKIPMAASTGGRMLAGALGGMAGGAMNPVTSGDFAEEKAKQMTIGGVAGGAIPMLAGGFSRLINPNAATNKNLALIKSEGVNPTIGQSLGGRWNSLEEKMQSIPIMGDMISNARTKALNQYNTAAINRSLKPIGDKVEGAGFDAVKQAGDKLSNAYDDVLSQIKAVKFDNQFDSDLSALRGMANNLTPPMKAKFNKLLNDNVLGRMSGNNSMLGDAYKKVDSELGNVARNWQKSSMASESEYGDAVAQLKNLLNTQMKRSNPSLSGKLDAIDDGWANLVRLEGAAKSGMNAEGLFTPAQLNMAIRQADQSTRGRAVSRGSALMQDLGSAGQQVLGNKVPNSFTTDRALIAGGTLGSYLLNPAIPASLVGGAGLYTSPIQKLLSSTVSTRPQSAKVIADSVRNWSPMLAPGFAQLPIGLLDQ
jgi:hypothetical protein